MTLREFEAYSEGFVDLTDLLQDVLAVLQSNLINIHIPAGKPKASPKKIRKNFGKRRGEAAPLPPAESGEEMRMRARRAISERESKEFWDSPEGRKLAGDIEGN